MTLRHDMKQWLIYDEGSVTSVVRALEASSMGWWGAMLERHPDLKVTAIGVALQRLADLRIATMISEGGDSETAVNHAARIALWLSTPGLEEPTDALDEFHAALFWLDSRLSGAGTQGPGWFRQLGRGD